jgi:hypothetical protein
MVSVTYKKHPGRDPSFCIKKTLLEKIIINANSFFLALYPSGNVSQFMAETVSVIENHNIMTN